MTAALIQAQIAAAQATQIAGLEPIAGAGLAFNLAYLALDRLRYRQQIEPLAEAMCQVNDKRASFDEFHDLDPVKELNWLARRESSRKFVPKGRHAALYRYGYRRHQDVVFCIGAAVICCFTLVTGVAQTVGRWSWSSVLLNSPIPGTLFYCCVAAIVVPTVSVIMGRKAVAWGKERIANCDKQVAIHLKAFATTAEPPTGAPEGGGQGPVRTLEELYRAELRRRQTRDQRGGK